MRAGSSRSRRRVASGFRRWSASSVRGTGLLTRVLRLLASRDSPLVLHRAVREPGQHHDLSPAPCRQETQHLRGPTC